MTIIKNLRSNHTHSLVLIYRSFLVFNRIEFPITSTSEKAIAKAPTIGFNNPATAIGIATTL